MYVATSEAMDRLKWAINKGIDIGDTLAEIAEIVMEQDIVTYCNENGCVSFDYDDFGEV